MLVEASGGPPLAGQTGDDPSPAPLPPLAAMLDRADADDLRLDLRLCLLAEFQRAADLAFARTPRPAPDAFRTLVVRHAAIVGNIVGPALRLQGIDVVTWEQLDGDTRTQLAELFLRRIYPVLTPLTVDSTHPFPQPPSLSLNIALSL